METKDLAKVVYAAGRIGGDAAVAVREGGCIGTKISGLAAAERVEG